MLMYETSGGEDELMVGMDGPDLARGKEELELELSSKGA